MKQLWTAALVFLFGFSSFSADIPHYDLEMTTQELIKALDLQITKSNEQTDPRLDPLIKMGKRSLAWLEYINQFRTDKADLYKSLSKGSSGISIDNPVKYSPDILLQQYQYYLNNVPSGIYEVVIDEKPFTKDPPVTDKIFLSWARFANSMYHFSLRWNLLLPYLDYLAERIAIDVRGYYFLKQEADLAQKLQSFSNLSEVDQQRLSRHLIGQCLNAGRSYMKCETELSVFQTRNTVLDFYKKYFRHAEYNYKSFFRIPNSAKRKDVTWSWSNPSVMSIPFEEIADQKIQEFVKYHIEDQYQWESWRLTLDLKRDFSLDYPRIKFEDGVIAHVDGAGGNIITLDSNDPLDERLGTVLRHEFGHVLGFLDCYVELYDMQEKMMINYQIDLTNFMCSGDGHFSQTHFDELQRVYYD